MNPSSPTTLAYSSDVFSPNWVDPILSPIGQTFSASQEIRLPRPPSTRPIFSSEMNNLVTIPADLHRQHYGPSDVESLLDLGYQRMAVGQRDDQVDREPRAVCMAEADQTSRQIGGLGYDYSTNHYKGRGNISLTGTTSYITSPRQANLSVPLVPIYEYTEFYPKSSSPKAGISGVDEVGNDSVNVPHFNASGSVAPASPQNAGVRYGVADAEHFGEQTVIDDHRWIATRYSMPWRKEVGFNCLFGTTLGASDPERTAAPCSIAPISVRRLFAHEFEGQSGPSVDSLVHRSPHPNVGGRRKPYAISGSSDGSHGRAVSPHASSSCLSVPSYRTQSPLWSVSTPALSTTSSLSTLSPIPRDHGMVEAIAPSIPTPHILADISRRPSSGQGPTNRRNGTTVSHLHRKTTSHILGVGITSGQPPGMEAPSTVIPRLLVAPLATSSSIPGDLARFLSISFQGPVNWWRRLALDTILQSDFLRNDHMEPVDKGNADEITMGFGKQGRSIYGVFVEEYTKGKWRCLFGSEVTPCPNNAVFKRFERAVEHVRSHLNHRPYKCDGSCNPEARTCQRKFFAHQYLRDHLTRKEKTPCETCGRSVLTQNIPRHNQLRHPE